MGHQHKNSQKPEENRGETLNNSLNISFPSEKREENNSISSSINNAVNISIVKEALEKDPKMWCLKEISTNQEMVLFLAKMFKDDCWCITCEPNSWK